MEPVTHLPPIRLPIVTFTDLDDTLLQTFRRRDPGDEGHIGAVDAEGAPTGWLCPKQQTLFTLLSNAGAVVPVTARPTDSLARVLLPFRSWKIASGGAVILRPDGSEDERWAQHVATRWSLAGTALEWARGFLDNELEECRAHVRTNVMVDCGRPAYLYVRRPRIEDPRQLQTWCDCVTAMAPEALFCTATDNTLVVQIADVTKATAVDYLLHEFPGHLVLGFGDGDADAGFLARCDYAAWPTGLNPYTQTRRAR